MPGSLRKQVLQCNSPGFKLEAILSSYSTNDSPVFVTELIFGHGLISSIGGKKEKNKEITSASLYVIKTRYYCAI